MMHGVLQYKRVRYYAIVKEKEYRPQRFGNINEIAYLCGYKIIIAVGTARAMEKGETYGAYASVGLILNGVLTAMLAPLVLKLMGI